MDLLSKTNLLMLDLGSVHRDEKGLELRFDFHISKFCPHTQFFVQQKLFDPLFWDLKHLIPLYLIPLHIFQPLP